VADFDSWLTANNAKLKIRTISVYIQRQRNVVKNVLMYLMLLLSCFYRGNTEINHPVHTGNILKFGVLLHCIRNVFKTTCT